MSFSHVKSGNFGHQVNSDSDLVCFIIIKSEVTGLHSIVSLKTPVSLTLINNFLIISSAVICMKNLGRPLVHSNNDRTYVPAT